LIEAYKLADAANLKAILDHESAKERFEAQHGASTPDAAQ
jgi:hypothetical protein